MASTLSKSTRLRPSSISYCSSSASPLLSSRATTLQVRHATLLRRPRRPWTFTNLTILSDGSTYVSRTTSPKAVVTSTKDIRNHPLWNPSEARFKNVEEDEAGRLRKFRERFGTGFDALTDSEVDGAESKPRATGQDDLTDLIEGGASNQASNSEATTASSAKKGGKI
jgi:ribosomal protein L31